MSFDNVIQIGMVVPDMAAANAALCGALGWKHWGVWETTPGAGRYYMGEEEDFICRMSFYSFGELELEVIEPLKGRSCWRDCLDATGGGIHHLLFDVDSEQRCREALSKNGWRVMQQGRARPYGEKVIWAYADTQRELGFTLEYTNRAQYPQTAEKRPQVEGPMKGLSGVRLLCADAQRLSREYQSRLGWRPEGTSFTYKFDTMELHLTEPVSRCLRTVMEDRGEGLSSLIIDVHGLADASARMEAGGARLVERTERASIYDLGIGCMIELRETGAI